MAFQIFHQLTTLFENFKTDFGSTEVRFKPVFHLSTPSGSYVMIFIWWSYKEIRFGQNSNFLNQNFSQTKNSRFL